MVMDTLPPLPRTQPTERPRYSHGLLEGGGWPKVTMIWQDEDGVDIRKIVNYYQEGVWVESIWLSAHPADDFYVVVAVHSDMSPPLPV